MGEKVCFIFDESNVLESSFLERMNAILASGEVPGLFDGDEYTALVQQCRDQWRQSQRRRGKTASERSDDGGGDIIESGAIPLKPSPLRAACAAAVRRCLPFSTSPVRSWETIQPNFCTTELLRVL